MFGVLAILCSQEMYLMSFAESEMQMDIKMTKQTLNNDVLVGI